MTIRFPKSHIEARALPRDAARALLNSDADIMQCDDRRIINALIRAADESDLWPICGRFNLANRTISHLRRFENAAGAMNNLEYVYAANSYMSSVVNSL